MSAQWVRVDAQFVRHLHTNGPSGPCASIQCYGLFGSLLSFENVATHLLSPIASHFGDVSLHDYRNESYAPIPGFEDRSFVNPEAKIGIFHGVVHDDLLRVMERHSYRIGCLVCEANIIPPSDIKICNQCFDLVVVPSSFCEQVFRKSGLNVQTLIVPHGITPAFQPTTDEPDEVFTFYNVYSQMRPFRKSEAELIQSFVSAFALDPGYRLKLRTSWSPRLEQLLESNQAMDVVHVLPDALPEAQYVRAFSQAHATVHPSKAEGFGMIPLQSLACETPVIAPAVTGLADYLNDDNAMLLRTSGMVRALHDVAAPIGGQYHAIDTGHLIECLIGMATNWYHEKQKVKEIAAGIRDRYSWERVAEPLINIIDKRLCVNN